MTDRLDEETERKIAALGDAMNGADDLAAAHALRSRIRTLADEARPKRDFDPPRTKDGSVAIMARITRPFPWSAEIKGPDDAVVFCGSHGNPSTYATIAECHTEADAMFIAYAPTLIELLLQEIDRMEHGDPVPPPSSPTSEPPGNSGSESGEVVLVPEATEDLDGGTIERHVLGVLPTSEPIPASDQLREALDVMTPAEHDVCCEFLCDSTGEATESEDCDCFLYQIKKARAAVEELFGAQQAEIIESAEDLRAVVVEKERLRELGEYWRRRFDEAVLESQPLRAELASLRVENERLEQWKALAQSDLRGLRSSSLTAEEAKFLQSCIKFPSILEERPAYNSCRAKLSALRSSTPDKGNTK